MKNVLIWLNEDVYEKVEQLACFVGKPVEEVMHDVVKVGYGVMHDALIERLEGGKR